MNSIENHLPQITGVLIAAILLGVGRAPLLPGVKSSRWLMWLAFIVTAVAGLILGFSLLGVVSWLTGLGGIAGTAISSIGALVALWMGWRGVHMLVPLIRDLADKTPDGDARRAALWVPTFLPAGAAGVWDIVSHPRGLGTGLVAAIMALITIVHVHLIVRDALKGKTGRVAWLWFATGVCLLGGLVTTPLVLYVDGVAANHLPTVWLVCLRILAGALGIALGIAAAVDLKDRIPDAYVRSFLRFGLPLLLTFGTLAVTTISGYASNGAQVLTGSMQ